MWRASAEASSPRSPMAAGMALAAWSHSSRTGALPSGLNRVTGGGSPGPSSGTGVTGRDRVGDIGAISATILEAACGEMPGSAYPDIIALSRVWFRAWLLCRWDQGWSEPETLTIKRAMAATQPIARAGTDRTARLAL